MKNQQYLLLKLSFAVLAFASLSAEKCGETHYISDSGFDLWCGETLCDWEVLKGDVAPATSWHKSDPAVELVGQDVLLSQLSTRSWTNCMRFEMLADIAEDAALVLEMDFYNDGHIDYSQEIGRTRWEKIVHLVSLPDHWKHVRFNLRKTGPGTVRIAAIEATRSSGDCVKEPIVIDQRPDGAYCTSSDECLSGICDGFGPTWVLGIGVCSQCGDVTPEQGADQSCEIGKVCGIASDSEHYLSVSRTCIFEGERQIGQKCAVNEECETGICCGKVCSSCCGNEGCENSELCEIAEGGSPLTGDPPHPFPRLCSMGKAGAPCRVDSECESDACVGVEGETGVCYDGRDCQVDEDCPRDSEGELTECGNVGLYSGSCQ